jgi:iron uptake system component EfeO
VPAGVRPAVCGLLSASLLAAGLAACGSSPSGNVISVSTGTCGTGWHDVRAGMQTFQLDNTSTAGAEVDLINPASGAIYAEVEQLGAGTTRPLRVNLAPGRYAFRCLLEDTDTLTGPVAQIGGQQAGDPGILPITTTDLLGPAKQYQAYVTTGLGTLARQVGRLTAQIRAGRLGAARAAWLPAHLTYERLGAAYGTFGNYDTEIDGRPDGLPGGVHDPAFTGFYRIEYGLWHGQSAAQLAGPAAKLDHDVTALRRFWPSMAGPARPRAAHARDPGERAAVPAHRARRQRQRDHAGHHRRQHHRDHRAAHGAAPAAGARYHGLPAVYTWLGRLHRLLMAARQRNGTWTPVSKLTVAQRERIDSAAGQALEELAPIAVIFEPRRT